MLKDIPGMRREKQLPESGDKVVRRGLSGRGYDLQQDVQLTLMDPARREEGNKYLDLIPPSS